MCNVKNENVRTYSPSMARCCPPLAAAHPRVSSLSLSLFLSSFQETLRLAHILSPSALIFLIFLSLALALSLHLDVVSVYQDRLEVAAAIFRWQHPPSLSFSPSLPPSFSLSLSLSLQITPSLIPFLTLPALCQHIHTNH